MTRNVRLLAIPRSRGRPAGTHKENAMNLLKTSAELATIVCLAALSLIAGSAAAQERYPCATVKIVSPYPPGGTTGNFFAAA